MRGRESEEESDDALDHEDFDVGDEDKFDLVSVKCTEAKTLTLV